MEEVEADHPARMAQERARGHLVGFVGGDSVGKDAPERRERPVGGLEDLAAGHLEDHVHGLASIGLDQALGEALRRRIDRCVGAELDGERALLLGGGGRDHSPGAERMAELHGQRADPAGRAVHDDALALGEVPGRAVEMPRGRALHDQRERRGVIDAVGNREDTVLGRRGVLRVAALADERHDALAAVLAHAGDLAAGDQRQRRLLDVGVGARVRVGEVHARERHPDQRLARGRLRSGQLGELEHLRAAELGHLNRAHRPSGYRRPACSKVRAHVDHRRRLDCL